LKFPWDQGSWLMNSPRIDSYLSISMALLRVSGSIDGQAGHGEVDLILNTQHVALAWPDSQAPATATLIHLVNGMQVRIQLPFEDAWTLIQRET